MPRFRNGRCNVNAGPASPQRAFVKFFASITPLTIRFHHHR